MGIITIGLDLAKNVFQVHGVDERGAAVLRKQLRRDQVVPFFARLQPCVIGIEACSGAHYWARKLREFGHTVRMMSPQFVTPYVKTNKNDAVDAEAICEAVARPNIRFVPAKTAEQQSVLALHTARAGFVKARTAQANQIGGLLAEFGLVIPQGIHSVCKRVPALIERAEASLPGRFRVLVERLLEHLRLLDRQVQATSDRDATRLRATRCRSRSLLARSSCHTTPFHPEPAGGAAEPDAILAEYSLGRSGRPQQSR
jgi:transposase